MHLKEISILKCLMIIVKSNEFVIVFYPFVKIVTFTIAVFAILKPNLCKRSMIFL